MKKTPIAALLELLLGSLDTLMGFRPTADYPLEYRMIRRAQLQFPNPPTHSKVP